MAGEVVPADAAPLGRAVQVAHDEAARGAVLGGGARRDRRAVGAGHGGERPVRREQDRHAGGHEDGGGEAAGGRTADRQAGSFGGGWTEELSSRPADRLKAPQCLVRNGCGLRGGDVPGHPGANRGPV
jgi:hypothetical protein